MATTPVDFASVGGKPVQVPRIDFSSIGGKPVGAPSQTLNPDQPGMQPAVNGLAPRDVSDKAEETVGRMVDHAKATISAPFEAGVKLVHDLRTGTFGDDGPHHIEKEGIIRGTGHILADSFKKLNPIAPDTGQGTLNRTADTVGNIEGMAISAEAMPTAEEAAAAKAQVTAGAKAAVPIAKAALSKSAGILRNVDPDVVGAWSPRAGNGLRVLQKAEKALNAPKEAASSAESTAAPVPASSISMTQFPPKAAPSTAAMDSPRGIAQYQFISKKSTLGVALQPVEQSYKAAYEANVGTKIKTIVDAAEEQTHKVISDAKAAGDLPDKMDDRAWAQEMNWDMEKQMYRGLSEERQKFFADNAPQFTKGQLVVKSKIEEIMDKAAGEAQKVLESAKIPSEVPKAKLADKITAARKRVTSQDTSITAKPDDDMTEILQRSLDAVKNRPKK